MLRRSGRAAPREGQGERSWRELQVQLRAALALAAAAPP
jgi:hypothetical protein